MLITLVRNLFETGRPLTIGVSDDRSEDVISAMTLEGWHVLSKIYGPPVPVVDSLQVALLEVSALPPGAPVRVAVELGASAAILNVPDVGMTSQFAHDLASPGQGVHQRLQRAPSFDPGAVASNRAP